MSHIVLSNNEQAILDAADKLRSDNTDANVIAFQNAVQTANVDFHAAAQAAQPTQPPAATTDTMTDEQLWGLMLDRARADGMDSATLMDLDPSFRTKLIGEVVQRHSLTPSQGALISETWAKKSQKANETTMSVRGANSEDPKDQLQGTHLTRKGSVAHKRPLEQDAEPSVRGDPEVPWSYHKKTVPADVPLRLLPQFVQLADSKDPADQLQGTLLVRKLLCVPENAPIDAVVASQVVPRLISFLLCDDDVDLQAEAAWAVTNVASGDSTHTKYVIERGAVPHFIHLLNSPSEKTRDKATWALGNIAGESTSSRDYILGQGVMAPLLQCITTPAEDIQVLRNGVWVVSNLCRSKRKPDLGTVCEILPVLVPLLAHDDEAVVAAACWTLAYISDGPPARIECVLNAGALPQIIRLLASDHASQQTPATRVVRNIATGSSEQAQLLVASGALPSFHGLLQHPSCAVRKEACFALSKITTPGTCASARIQAVLDDELFPVVFQCINDAEDEIKKGAVLCISNLAAGGTPVQLRFVVEELNVFNELVRSLPLYDTKILKVALKTLLNLLEAGEDAKERRGLAENPYAQMVINEGGVSHLKNLWDHTNSDIHFAAVSIVDTFFERADTTFLAAAAPTNSAGGCHV